MGERNQYHCTLIETYINKSKNDAYPFYHNVTLPFVPFYGLVIHYNNLAFDQGVERGKVLVREFKASPIKFIKYDFDTETFDCFLDDVSVDDDKLHLCIEDNINSGWFPAYDNDSNKFDRFMKYLEERIV